jgi:DCN1-like protein 1/2
MSGRALSKGQRDKVSQLAAITGASTRAAVECLQVSGWVMEAAVDCWYSSGMAQAVEGAAPRVDRTAITQLYQHYKDPDTEAVLAEGIMKLCEDLGIEPEDTVMLVLSWHLKAAAMGEFSREEFEGGLGRLAVDSLDKLRDKLPALRAQLDDPASYRDIYNFAYGFSCEKGQKCVQLEMALAMWQILAPPQRWRYIEDWCEFLRKHHGRAVSRDTWTQLLDFMLNIKPDFSNYDENGAWPYLVDEFVTQTKAKQAAAEDGMSN